MDDPKELKTDTSKKGPIAIPYLPITNYYTVNSSTLEVENSGLQDARQGQFQGQHYQGIRDPASNFNASTNNNYYNMQRIGNQGYGYCNSYSLPNCGYGNGYGNNYMGYAQDDARGSAIYPPSSSYSYNTNNYINNTNSDNYYQSYYGTAVNGSKQHTPSNITAVQPSKYKNNIFLTVPSGQVPDSFLTNKPSLKVVSTDKLEVKTSSSSNKSSSVLQGLKQVTNYIIHNNSLRDADKCGSNQRVSDGAVTTEMKLVLIAPDTEQSVELDRQIDRLLTQCEAYNVPVLYCLNRRQLGKIVQSTLRQAAVGVINTHLGVQVTNIDVEKLHHSLTGSTPSQIIAQIGSVNVLHTYVQYLYDKVLQYVKS